MKIARTLAILAVAFAITLVSTTSSVAREQIATEPLVKNLMSLGLAHPTSGKLLPGSIADATSVVGAVTQNTDNTLNTLTLDAAMLGRVGRGVFIAGWGTTAANGNTKDIKLFLGATAICTLTDITNSGDDWLLGAVLLSNGTNTQIGYCIGILDGATNVGANVMFTATENAQVAIAVKTTGNNNSAAASAATGKGLTVIPIG